MKSISAGAAPVVPACAALLCAALSLTAFGQTVGGVTRDSSSGKPLAEVQVTAHNLNKGTDRATVSDTDGKFTFAGLEPGSYEFEAVKEGFQKLSARTEIDAQAARVELPLQLAPGSSAPLTAREKEMLERIERLERRLAAMEAASVNTGETRQALVASLNPVPSIPTPASQNLPAPDTAQATGPQQSGGKSGPIATPPTPVAPAEHRMPDALQTPEPGSHRGQPDAVRVRRFHLAQRHRRATKTRCWIRSSSLRKFDSTRTTWKISTSRSTTPSSASTESFRSGEVQIEQASVGGDFHWQNVRGRILFMDGLFATTTPRNDASSATGSGNGNTGGVGQWDLQNAYKYVSEAYGGYHFNVQHGLNVDAGIFVSYIGLFSYYNFDNWTYQPSYVSSNTPWFFNGVRVQWFPTNKLKIEPWFINGWQSYAKYNGHPGLGGQLLWMPKEWFKLVANQYGYGEDNLGLPKTQRIHTDDSIEVRYYNNPESLGLSKMAFSLTGDAGCQYGGGITCHGGPNKSSFLGWMLYDRMWFHKDLFALTLGGGEMSNSGRYLTLLPPIDGAWAASGTPYFTEDPGQKAHMWDSTVTLQYMPKQYITWWAEVGYRHSDVPYFAGRGGVTPPGGNNGYPQYYTCMSGATAGTANSGGGASGLRRRTRQRLVPGSSPKRSQAVCSA